MASTRTLLWVVDTVEGKYDPPDMYFATVSRIGYEDENPLPESTYVRPEGPRFLR